MAINLGGTTAWRVDDQLPPDSYIFRAATVERTQSKSGNEQVQVDWRVITGPFKGAEQRDWITFTETAMGRVVMVIEAIGEESPTQDFNSYAELADWLAGLLQKNGGAIAEGIIRYEPGQKDPTKEFPKMAGYRKPNPSDVPNDASGFASGPNVNGTVCKQDGCEAEPVKDGFCKQHSVPF